MEFERFIMEQLGGMVWFAINFTCVSYFALLIWGSWLIGFATHKKRGPLMTKDHTDVSDLQTARRLLIAYDETTRKCADEIERLRNEITNIRADNYMLREELNNQEDLNDSWREENEQLKYDIKRIVEHSVTKSRVVVSVKAEIERLREALRTICDGPRDVEKSYAELFVEVKIEARAALKGE